MKYLNKQPTLLFFLLPMVALTACTTKMPTKQPVIKVVHGVQQPKTTQIIQTTPAPIVVHSQPAMPVQTKIATDNYHYKNFDEWKYDFINRVIAKGYDSNLVYQLMGNAVLNQRIIDLDRSQSEFTKMPWEYVNGAVSANRIQQGRVKIDEYPTTFNNAQNNYGVPKQIVAAIWGMESSFGAGMGNIDLVSALSSLAYDGRRREFAENQLTAMLDMLNRGDAMPSQFKGSWAGGMGHTQFIPSTWIKEGVDGNHDGQISPWGIGDSLNSTASYLKNSGWIADLAPYYEVSLPADFDYRLLDNKQSLDAWKNLGLTSPSGEYFGGQYLSKLWLPAGKNGPALLLTQNFDVIKVYNNSSSYALAVSMLAKRIIGGDNLVASWPSYEKPLTRTQIQTLQKSLTMQGFDTKGIDGVAGENTRKAFARWQLANGQIPDGFISQNSVSNLIW